MLIQIKEKEAILKLNCRFYSINAIIAANTKFSEQFSTEVAFAILNIGKSLYHQVKLMPKGHLHLKEIYAYANEALKYPEPEFTLSQNTISQKLTKGEVNLGTS